MTGGRARFSVRAMLPRLLPAAVAAALILPAAAGASTTTFKVVKATHSSSSSKSTSDYTGTSTASWSLAKATSAANNRITVNQIPGQTTGLGQVNVTGSYSIDATKKDWGHCAFTAATGDEEHAAVYPRDFMLTIGPNPHTGKGLLAGIMASAASLGNPYLGTECNTELDGEPDADDVNLIPVKPSAFKKKTVTLRFHGATSEDSIDYRWSTVIVLKKVR